MVAVCSRSVRLSLMRPESDSQVTRFGHSVPGSGVAKTRPLLPVIFLAAALFAGCNVGPRYHRPSVETPQAFKELTPEGAKQTAGWSTAQPKDFTSRGKWWELFNDPQLNALEEQASVSNQTVAASLAAFFQARALVKQARSQYYPTVSTSPGVTRQRQSLGGGASAGGRSSTAVTFSTYSLPFDATWEPDLWGVVRNTVKANVFEAQARIGDLQNVRLTQLAELAVDYFELRAQDAQKKILDDTVRAFQDSLNLTQARFHTGIASDEDVAQAQTLLTTTQAQDTDLDILRTQYEHAIAMLIGQPASSFSFPRDPLIPNPIPIPFGLPSELLERRPDVSAAERRMAEANAQIGVAKAAYYPTLNLSASGGFQGPRVQDMASWPSLVWAVGASLAETLFDAGKRAAVTEQARATYDQDVANYRQTVLTAFQEVEDNLASLRILTRELEEQAASVKASQHYLDLSTARYKLGIDSYLNVITAQATLLSNQRTLVNLQLQQMVASVQLIKAVGGGWDASQLPEKVTAANPSGPQPTPQGMAK
ncbi:RND efflux system, outer membrane lipoprotein, NodT family [Verrucomicrobia bacterium]|nr:RND efflux system, outer membrane lipoprotein, NodT family [Verrucomicrobiota bacterium]